MISELATIISELFGRSGVTSLFMESRSGDMPYSFADITKVKKLSSCEIEDNIKGRIKTLLKDKLAVKIKIKY